MKVFCGYHVTEGGELFSLKTGMKKYTWINKGRCGLYERVQFIVNGKPKNYYVHRIVAQMYLPNWDETLEVDHLNGNTLDNSASNMSMKTRSENALAYHEMVRKVIRNTNCIVKQGKKKPSYTAGEIT